MTPQQLAEACAEAMWAEDKASQGLGMDIVDVGPGKAEIAMTIDERMVNGHGICHGGYIFTLADSAFAFACNSYNRLTVAQHNSIDFLRPGRQGERLVAVAREVSRSGRSGVYDAEVRSNDVLIAVFRGLSREIGGTHFDEEETSDA